MITCQNINVARFWCKEKNKSGKTALLLSRNDHVRENFIYSDHAKEIEHVEVVDGNCVGDSEICIISQYSTPKI